MLIEDLPESILKLNVIEDISGLSSIYPSWQELYKQDVNSTPFQSPDWIIPWCSYFINEKIHLISISDREELISIAPFYIFEQNGKKELKLIGTGNTDYNFPLIKKSYHREVFDLLNNYIYSIKEQFDNIYLEGIPETLKKFFPNYKLFKITEPYPTLQVQGNFSSYINNLSGKFIGNIRRSCRQLEEMGELLFQSAGTDELDEYMEQLFILHERSWNERESSGVLKDKKTQDFHKEAVKNLFRNKSVRLFRLTLNKEPIASLYMLTKEDTYYYYIGGFAPEYKKFSPGSVILYKIIEEAFKYGINKIDFLRGGEAYKYKWGAADTYVYILFLNRQELISS
jgi:CelD/BcsL family acetyltransferase involved in cellulose biosynthesis